MTDTTIEGINIKFGADTVEIDNSIPGINRALKAVKAEAKSLDKQLKFDPKNVELITKKMKNLETEAELSKAKLQKLRAEFKELGDEDIGTDKWLKLKRQISDTEGELAVIVGKAEQTRNAIKQIDDVELGSIDNEVKEVERSMDGIITAVAAAGIAMKNVGDTMTNTVTRPIVDFAKDGVEAQSDLLESLNKTEVAFGNNADKVKAWADANASSFGELKGDVLESASTYGLLGLSAEDSMNAVTRAVDLASLHNRTFADVQSDIQSALNGSTEVMEKYGVKLKVIDLAQYMVEQGMASSTKEANSLMNAMSSAEKQALYYEKIMSDTASAQGDFANNAGEYANQNKIYEATMAELRMEMGQMLLPVITAVKNAVIGFVNWFKKAPGPIKAVVVVIALLVAVIGPLLSIIGTIMSALPGFMLLLGGMGPAGASAGAGLTAGAAGATAFQIALGPIALIIGGIILAIGAIVGAMALWDAAWTDTAEANEHTNGELGKLRASLLGVQEPVEELTPAIVEQYQEMGILKQEIENVNNAVGDMNDAMQVATAGMDSAVAEKVTNISNNMIGLTETFISQSTSIQGIDKTTADVMLENMQTYTDQAKNEIDVRHNDIIQGYKNDFDAGRIASQEQLDAMIADQERLRENEKTQVQTTQDQVKAILSKAGEEKRTLTATEIDQVMGLLQNEYTPKVLGAFATTEQEKKTLQDTYQLQAMESLRGHLGTITGETFNKNQELLNNESAKYEQLKTDLAGYEAEAARLRAAGKEDEAKTIDEKILKQQGLISQTESNLTALRTANEVTNGSYTTMFDKLNADYKAASSQGATYTSDYTYQGTLRDQSTQSNIDRIKEWNSTPMEDKNAAVRVNYQTTGTPVSGYTGYGGFSNVSPQSAPVNFRIMAFSAVPGAEVNTEEVSAFATNSPYTLLRTVAARVQANSPENLLSGFARNINKTVVTNVPSQQQASEEIVVKIVNDSPVVLDGKKTIGSLKGEIIQVVKTEKSKSKAGAY